MNKQARNAANILRHISKRAPKLFKKMTNHLDNQDAIDLHKTIGKRLSTGNINKEWSYIDHDTPGHNHTAREGTLHWLYKNFLEEENAVRKRLGHAYDIKQIRPQPLSGKERHMSQYGKPVDLELLHKQLNIPKNAIVAYNPPNTQLLTTPHFANNPFTETITTTQNKPGRPFLKLQQGQVYPSGNVDQALEHFSKINWPMAKLRQSEKLPTSAHFINFTKFTDAQKKQLLDLNRIGRRLFNRGIRSKHGQPINAFESQYYETVIPEGMRLQPHSIYIPANHGDAGAITLGQLLRQTPPGTLFKGPGASHVPTQLMPMFEAEGPKWLTAQPAVAGNYNRSVIRPLEKKLINEIKSGKRGDLSVEDGYSYIAQTSGDPLSNLYVKKLNAELTKLQQNISLQNFLSKHSPLKYGHPVKNKLETEAALNAYYKHPDFTDPHFVDSFTNYLEDGRDSSWLTPHDESLIRQLYRI